MPKRTDQLLKFVAGNWFQITQTLLLTGAVIFAGFQWSIYNKTLEEAQTVNSANFILKIGEELNKPEYKKIASAIDDYKSDHPILTTKDHLGFSASLLEDYIGNFETVGSLARQDLIDKTLAYNEMGYKIEKAWCNRDVQKFIQARRIADKQLSGPNAFYCGFEDLATTFLKNDNKTSSDLDEE